MSPASMAETAYALHIVLVEPEIHWNVGNAGRTCLAVGAQLHLVEPLGLSLDERQVRRAGLDYWERVQPRIWPDLPTFEGELPELGEPFLLSPRAGRALWSARFPERCVLLFGRESVGFRNDVRERYHDRLLEIPMQAGSVRSLNLSTCVAVAAYEVLRQWHTRAAAVPPPVPDDRTRSPRARATDGRDGS
jgi:tRNA (cytidine/uridine-2'-O-)-methyltransferase